MASSVKIPTNGVAGWAKAADIEMCPEHWGRAIAPERVRKYGAEFDADGFAVVHIWRRMGRPIGGGRFVTVDGQHRTRAVVDVLDWGDQLVPCMFYDDLTDAQAADLALMLEDRRSSSAYDRHRKEAAAQWPRARTIDRVLAELGLTLCLAGASNGRNQIMCVAALEHSYERLGEEGLRRVLEVLISAWPGVDGSLSADMVKLVGLIMATYEADDVDIDRLAKVLRKDLPFAWLAEAKSRASRRTLGHVAQEIVALYNRRRTESNRLDEKPPTSYVMAYRRTANLAGAKARAAKTVQGRLTSGRGSVPRRRPRGLERSA